MPVFDEALGPRGGQENGAWGVGLVGVYSITGVATHATELDRGHGLVTGILQQQRQESG